jgi:hypothetical protein
MTFDLVTQVILPGLLWAFRLRASSTAKRAMRSAPLGVTTFTAKRPTVP